MADALRVGDHVEFYRLITDHQVSPWIPGYVGKVGVIRTYDRTARQEHYPITVDFGDGKRIPLRTDEVRPARSNT